MREWLGQLKHLNSEIESLKEQIEELKRHKTSDVVETSSRYWPYLKGSLTIEGLDGETLKAVSRLERRLSLRLSECLLLHEEMMDYINTIDDSELRQILSLYYINGLPWREIAASLGYADESVPRKRCKRFLDDMENDR